MTLPRGLRANNPGNIKEGSGAADIDWVGERASNDDPIFEEFATMADGIRAMARILGNYQRKHGLLTVRAMITRWAPPGENHTNSYVNYVADQMGLRPDTPFDFIGDQDAAILMMAAITKMENGQCPLSELEFIEGHEMAWRT